MAIQQKELASWLALSCINGIGPVTFAKLLERYGDPQQLLADPSIVKVDSPTLYKQLTSPAWGKADEAINWLNQQEDRFILTLKDPRYPTLLKTVSDPPPVLYIQGDITALSTWQLAIVGSRNPSVSGKNTAFDFASFLAQAGLVITSGLAIGIDAAAHQGAIARLAKTIAVVATGLDRVYPAKHKKLAHQIVENGAIVSEFPLGTQPKPENFPRRNRIISGMSLGTLIVEAALKSGSLITARMAMEQSREVFAIPGSIHNPLSRGCHKLIREGAKLVETVDDIIEELGALASVQPLEEQALDNETKSQQKDSDYQVLFDYLGYDPVTIDALIENSGLTADEVSSMLLILELEGEVELLPGARYVRTGS